MSTIVTIYGTKYEILSNDYEGDILLSNLEGGNDLEISGGYKELEHAAIQEHGYMPKGADTPECDQQMIDFYIEQNVEAYVLDHCKEAVVIED